MTAPTDSSASLDVPAFRPEMAFPLLTDDMIESIRGYASEVAEPAGTSIFSRGQHDTAMFLVLEGTVNIYTGDEKNDIEREVVNLRQNASRIETENKEMEDKIAALLSERDTIQLKVEAMLDAITTIDADVAEAVGR